MNKKYSELFLFTSSKIGLLIILIIGLSFFTSAMSCEPYENDPTHQACTEIKTEIYNTTTPIINVTFQESVAVNGFDLYRIGDTGTEYPEDLLEIKPTFQHIEIHNISASLYQPNRHVNDGVYIFRINAFNVPNINIDVAVLFEINGTGMEYWVTKPANRHITSNNPNEHPNFAVSSNNSFFLEIKAERQIEECRFSVFDYGISSQISLQEYFEDYMTESFTTNISDGNMTAYILNFSMNNYYSGYNFDGELKVMHIICKEPQGKYSYNQIFVGVDQTPPTINVSAIPNPIVDYMMRTTNISIVTSDRSVCTMRVTNQPSGTNKPIINRSPNYNFRFLEEFVNMYGEQHIYNNVPNPYNYTYNITCDNLANLRTSKLFTANVDLEILQTFEFYKPEGTINTLSVFINGSTTIGNVTCTASLNKTSGFITLTKATNFFVNGRQVYTGTIASVPEGNNIVYVNCSYMGTGEFSQKNFRVDRTPPTAPNITMDKNSCSLTKISATVKSTDNISGVDKYYYNFTLEGDTNNTYTEDGTSTSGQLSINIASYGKKIDGKTYTLKTWAVDDAGNIGVQSTATILVSNSSIVPCDKIKPKIDIFAVQDISTKEWTVKVNCTDKESGCQPSIGYGIEINTSKACQIMQSAGIMLPITVTRSAKFCAVVYDNNNNNDSKERSLVVVYPATCSNLQKDGNETDIDCGGECPKCLNGQRCIVNNDCVRNYCLLGNCTEPSCIDLIKNGDETSLDCGGSCPSCGIGGNCTGDDDCQSLNCAQGGCAEANCTDNKKDGLETDKDCGGGSCPLCERGKNCLVPGDCVTSYCDSARKVCEIDPSKDTDGDGLPDVWEEKYCGSFTGCDPNADPDEDGYTNLEEYKDGTDPLDSTSHPEYKKYNKVSIIFLIIGALLIIAGIIVKVLDVMEQQKQVQLKEEKEMQGTLGMIPKLTSIQSQEQNKHTAQDELLRQQARNKTLKLKELERRKILDNFGEESTSEKSSVTTSTTAKSKLDEKKTQEQKKTKYIDEGSNEEYLELGKSKDAFSKLKDLTEGKKPAPKEPEKEIIKKETQKSQTKKPKQEDEVFEKLKKITKQTKNK